MQARLCSIELNDNFCFSFESTVLTDKLSWQIAINHRRVDIVKGKQTFSESCSSLLIEGVGVMEWCNVHLMKETWKTKGSPSSTTNNRLACIS